ncbi:hypothetical protein AcV5_005449 [Taiwanofungus camphoratus]|nr:hypothetical protein AcV5_005449 [Antrodia cinnamomea]
MPQLDLLETDGLAIHDAVYTSNLDETEEAEEYHHHMTAAKHQKLHAALKEIDHLFVNIASQHDVLYEVYYSENALQESRQPVTPDTPDMSVHVLQTRAHISKCYQAFQKTYPDTWLEKLRVYYELQILSRPGQTIGSCKRTFCKFFEKMKCICESFSTMYGFQSAILSTGNNVQQDDIIGGIFETDGIKGALQRMTRAESLDEILGHFKAHAVYNVSENLLNMRFPKEEIVEGMKTVGTFNPPVNTSLSKLADDDYLKIIKEHITKMIVDLKGSTWNEKSNSFPWKTMSGLLHADQLVIINWPENVRYSGQGNDIKKGIATLTQVEQRILAKALTDSVHPLGCQHAMDTDQVKSSHIVIYGIPPAPESTHVRSLRVFVSQNGSISFDYKGIQRQVTTHNSSISISSTSDADHSPSAGPRKCQHPPEETKPASSGKHIPSEPVQKRVCTTRSTTNCINTTDHTLTSDAMFKSDSKVKFKFTSDNDSKSSDEVQIILPPLPLPPAKMEQKTTSSKSKGKSVSITIPHHFVNKKLSSGEQQPIASHISQQDTVTSGGSPVQSGSSHPKPHCLPVRTHKAKETVLVSEKFNQMKSYTDSLQASQSAHFGISAPFIDASGTHSALGMLSQQGGGPVISSPILHVPVSSPFLQHSQVDSLLSPAQQMGINTTRTLDFEMINATHVLHNTPANMACMPTPQEQFTPELLACAAQFLQATGFTSNSVASSSPFIHPMGFATSSSHASPNAPENAVHSTIDVVAPATNPYQLQYSSVMQRGHTVGPSNPAMPQARARSPYQQYPPGDRFPQFRTAQDTSHDNV